jgi:hypothetical protein
MVVTHYHKESKQIAQKREKGEKSSEVQSAALGSDLR